MDFKLLIAVCLISSIYSSPTYNEEEEDFFKDITSDDYYGSEEETDYSEEEKNDKEDKFRLNDKNLKFDISNDKQEDEQTEPPEAKYEVTEIVDDIPNNTTVAGPIIANFTIAVPINTAIVTNVTDINNTASNNNGMEGTPSTKRNYISIFHIKAEYDNDKPEITVIQNNRPNLPVFNGFREYIKGIRQGIINGIQSFVNNNSFNNLQNPINNVSNDNNNGPDVHNIVNAPVVFWNKLQNRNAAVTGRQNIIFGR